MAFNLPFGVRVAGNDPVDKDRYQVGTIAERDQLVTDGRAYDGLQVYVISEQIVFILKGTTNSDWEIFGNGTGSGSTDYVSNITLNGTDLEVTGVGNAFSSTVDLSSLSGGSGGLQNVVEDLTPELGGNLEIGENSITSSTSGIVEFNVTPQFSISRFDFSGFLKANDFGNLISTSQMTLGLEDSRSSLIDLYAGNGSLGGRVRFWNGNDFRAHDFWIVGSKSINVQNPDNFSIAFGNDVGDPRDMGTPVFEIDATTKQIIFSQYGSNNFTGTAAQYLAVDVDGNIIEEPIPVGGGGGSTDYVSDITLNGSDLEITGIGSAFNSTVDLSSLTGTSLPDGGTTNQALRKLSDADQDFDWQDDPSTEWSGIEGNQEDVNLIGFTDGISGDFLGFTEKNIVNNKNITDLSFANGFFYATNYNEDASYQKSLDGENWTNESFGIGGTESWTAPIFENGIYISVGGDKILTSTNGNTWTAQSVFSFQTFQIAFKDGIFVVASNFTSKKIAYSSDGFVWTEVDLPFNESRNKILRRSDDLFVLSTNQNPDKLFISTNGQLWTESIKPDLDGQIFGITTNKNNIYIAIKVFDEDLGLEVTHFYSSINGVDWKFISQVDFTDAFGIIFKYINGWFIFKGSISSLILKISRDLIFFDDLSISASSGAFIANTFAKDVLVIADEDSGRIVGSKFTQSTIFENTINKVVDSNGVEVPITDKVLQLPASTGNDLTVKVESTTGGADYADTQYTTGSPFILAVADGTVTLPNNAGNTYLTQVPEVLDRGFYQNDLIQGYEDSFFNVTIEFKVRPTSAASNIRLKTSIDIGGAVGEIYPRNFNPTKGNGVEHFYSASFLYYTRNTFEANGGAVKVSTENGDVEIYDIRYVFGVNHYAGDDVIDAMTLDEYAAIKNANTPSATNPFATVNDSNKDTIGVFLSALGADLTTGATATIEAPYDFTLVSAFIAVTDAPTGGNVVVDFIKNGASITSTNASIEANEFNSLTGIAPVFTTTSFVKGDRITHNIIQVGSLNTGRELKSYLEVIKT